MVTVSDLLPHMHAVESSSFCCVTGVHNTSHGTSTEAVLCYCDHMINVRICSLIGRYRGMQVCNTFKGLVHMELSAVHLTPAGLGCRDAKGRFIDATSVGAHETGKCPKTFHSFPPHNDQSKGRQLYSCSSEISTFAKGVGDHDVMQRMVHPSDRAQHKLPVHVSMALPGSREQGSCTWISSSARLLDMKMI